MLNLFQDLLLKRGDADPEASGQHDASIMGKDWMGICFHLILSFFCAQARFRNIYTVEPLLTLLT